MSLIHRLWLTYAIHSVCIFSKQLIYNWRFSAMAIDSSSLYIELAWSDYYSVIYAIHENCCIKKYF